MKTMTLVAAICLMAGAPAIATAAQSGASRFAPGQEMQSRGGNASSFAPGQMKKRFGRQSAAEFSPGDRMNDKRKRY